MTTNSLDNQNMHFQDFIVVAVPMKNSVLGQFSSLPPTPPPLQNEHVIFIVVSPSLIYQKIAPKEITACKCKSIV